MTIIQSFTKHRKKKAVLDSLIEKLPNGLVDYKLYQVHVDSGSMTSEELESILLTLTEEQKIDRVEFTNKYVEGRKKVSYVVKNRENYEYNQIVKVGNIEFKRFFHGDIMGAEEMERSL